MVPYNLVHKEEKQSFTTNNIKMNYLYHDYEHEHERGLSKKVTNGFASRENNSWVDLVPSLSTYSYIIIP